MRLIQFMTPDNLRQVGVVHDNGQQVQLVQDATRVYELALQADQNGISLTQLVQERLGAETADYEAIIRERRVSPPLDHPDPAHCYVTGTGLTHLGSGQARNAMHAKLEAEAENLTDSMKMFKLGLEGGKPAAGEIGVQPEWFYKGDGDCIVAPEHPLDFPAYALDGGEEAEIVGLYVIGMAGEVLRVGFALGNEFADHILEKQNYLYLAHSKLRQCSIGPELLLGNLPEDISISVQVLRNNEPLWSGQVPTGEINMSHTIANMEHHHFKYATFRRPGDVHCHFFGTAALSFSGGVSPQPDDVFEISAALFGRPLRNRLGNKPAVGPLISVRAL